MFILDIFEADDGSKKHAAFCFGRMNPPTLGHKELLKKTAEAAGTGDYYIFPTKTQKLPDNPLDFATKYKFIARMFPEYAAHVVKDPSIKTIIQAAAYLYDLGYTDVTYVAGSDRLPDFKKMLDAYNGRGQPGDAGYYKFNSINYASAGERDPDAEGLSGISASKARAAAARGDFEDFKAKTGAGELAQSLYDAVRRAQGVEEDVEVDAQSSTSPIHGGQFESRGHKILARKLADIEARRRREEDAARRAEAERKEKEAQRQTDAISEMGGVGVIANRKQARDPRYSMSLTKDVRPGAIQKSLRALRLAEQSDPAISENVVKFQPCTLSSIELSQVLRKHYQTISEQTGQRWYPHRCSALAKHIANYQRSQLTENAGMEELRQFLDRLKDFDERARTRVAVGESISIIRAVPHVFDKIIEVSGFQNPKKIKSIVKDSKEHIKWIEFTDGSTYPDRHFIAAGRGGGELEGTATLIYPNAQSASSNLTAIRLAAPETWKFSLVNLQEASVMKDSSEQIDEMDAAMYASLEQQGVNAFRDGHKQTANPYSPGSHEYKQWALGWQRAKQGQERAKSSKPAFEIVRGSAKEQIYSDYRTWAQDAEQQGYTVYAGGAASPRYTARVKLPGAVFQEIVGEFDKSVKQGYLLVRPAKGVTEGMNDRQWFNDYRQWKMAARELDTDDDGKDYVRLDGKLIAHWRGSDGWIDASTQGMVEDVDGAWSVEHQGMEHECRNQDHAINKARKLISTSGAGAVIKHGGKPVYKWELGQKIQTLGDDVTEGLRDPKDNPCWKGYYPVGTKKKNGRTVPNCVPKPKK